MLTWMLYVLVITLLLSGPRLAAERSTAASCADSLDLAVTIVASLGMPVLIASVSVQVPSLLTPTAARRVVALRDDLRSGGPTHLGA